MNTQTFSTAAIAAGEVQLLQLHEVKKITGMSTTFIYDAMKKGEFPKQKKIGRAARWISTEVEEWLQQKINQSTECA